VSLISPVVVAITEEGGALARRIGAALAGAEVALPVRFADGDVTPFEEPLSELLPRLFIEGRPLVCIMATGIVVRILAPHLKGKGSDPAVVVLDEEGRFAISLLSGHLGGANALARRVADITGGEAVITTATDVRGLPAWDEVARMEGLSVGPLRNIRHLNGCLLCAEPVALVDPKRRISGHFERVAQVRRFDTVMEADGYQAAGRVFVTHHLIPDLEGRDDVLLLRPRDLVVGIGCNRGTTADEIESEVATVLRESFLAAGSVRCVATIDEKGDEAGLIEFARRWNLTIETHRAEDLNAVAVPSPPSAYAMKAVGAAGVCEPAALLSAAPGRLLVEKQKRGNVTVAVAERAE